MSSDTAFLTGWTSRMRVLIYVILSDEFSFRYQLFVTVRALANVIVATSRSIAAAAFLEVSESEMFVDLHHPWKSSTRFYVVGGVVSSRINFGKTFRRSVQSVFREELFR